MFAKADEFDNEFKRHHRQLSPPRRRPTTAERAKKYDDPRRLQIRSPYAPRRDVVVVAVAVAAPLPERNERRYSGAVRFGSSDLASL